VAVTADTREVSKFSVHNCGRVVVGNGRTPQPPCVHDFESGRTGGFHAPGRFRPASSQVNGRVACGNFGDGIVSTRAVEVSVDQGMARDLSVENGIGVARSDELQTVAIVETGRRLRILELFNSAERRGSAGRGRRRIVGDGGGRL